MRTIKNIWEEGGLRWWYWKTLNLSPSRVTTNFQFSYIWKNFPLIMTCELEEERFHNQRQKRCIEKGRRGRDMTSPRTPPQMQWPTSRRDPSPLGKELSLKEWTDWASHQVPQSWGLALEKQVLQNIWFWKTVGIKTSKNRTVGNRETALKGLAHKPTPAEFQHKNNSLKSS